MLHLNLAKLPDDNLNVLYYLTNYPNVIVECLAHGFCTALIGIEGLKNKLSHVFGMKKKHLEGGVHLINSLYKLLCIDVDGTLFASHKNLPEENRKAVQKANKTGIKIAIASGRSPSSVQEILDSLGIKGYGICLNGSYIKDDDKRVSQYTFSTNQVTVVKKIVEKYDVKSFFSTAAFNITNKALSGDQLKVVQTSVNRQGQLITCVNKDELTRALSNSNGSILKVSIVEPDGYKYQKVRKELEDTHVFDVAKSDTNSLDVTIKGINKSRGVKDLAEYLNIDLPNIICIGDNENDIEMIKAAGLGIAMANASHKLLDVSDAITLSNDECGVAKVIYDYILK